MIALVQRPRRKVHLAGQRAGQWWPVCDRIVLPIEGTATTSLEEALGTIDDRAGDVCQDCHRLILMAAFVGRDRVAALVASLERAA